MATQENTFIETHLPSNLQKDSFEVINPPYMHDLKNTLEFDRKCRALEILFLELDQRIATVEKNILKFKSLH